MIEGVEFGELFSTLGVAGPFIWYLISEKSKDREERELRRKADIRLAIALERFVQRLTGQVLTIPEGENDV